MNIFKRKKKKETEERGYTPFSFNSLLFNSSSKYTTNKAMLLSAVYRCVTVISDSVAQLPLEPFKVDNKGFKRAFKEHPAYYILNKEPNSTMSRFTFIQSLITSVLLKGNGYALISRDNKGDAIGLTFIPSDYVFIDKTDNKIRYNITGYDKLIEAVNMIHILNFTYDGIEGTSTLSHAINTLKLSTDSEAHAEGFFKGGANLAGVLTVQGNLTNTQKKDIKEGWQSTFNSTTGTPNGIAVLPGNMEFKPITVSPADAQLLETRQFNVIDICRFFGVSPTKAFDYSKSSYSTLEASQLAFLTDTLSPLLEKMELEFERKLFKPSERNNIDVKFDTSVLLRADKESLANYYNKLFQMGVITPNEIRKKLNLEPLKNGDKSFVQVNVMTLDNAVLTVEEKNKLSNSLNASK